MGFFNKVKDSIVKTGKDISAEIERRQEIRRKKLQILNQLDMKELKRVCKNYGIGQPLNYDPVIYAVEGKKVKFTLTRNHYINHIINKMTLEQISNVGQKLRVEVPEIYEEEKVEPVIIKETAEEIEPEAEEPTDKDKKKYDAILKQIKAFRPSRVFKKEAEYENTLYSRLEVFFPQIEQQVPFANSRIDLKIDKFGIEIKNHPDQNEINRLVGQLLSYRKYFKHIIVVIFNPKDMKAIKYLKEQIKEFKLAVTVIVK